MQVLCDTGQCFVHPILITAAQRSMFFSIQYSRHGILKQNPYFDKIPSMFWTKHNFRRLVLSEYGGGMYLEERKSETV